MIDCIFCQIARGEAAASIAHADALTLAFIDLRQFHPGHVLVIPRAHLHDLRELDAETAAALMQTVVRMTRAVDRCFPNQGISLWHSIGPGAHQEVPHLHVHIQPRKIGDGFLRVYPGAIPGSTKAERDDHAARLRAELALEADVPGQALRVT